MQGQPYVEAVLCAVEQIPPGRVLSYGDVAELVGAGGPRQVGHVMATYGGAVPWWRVVRADGSTAVRKEAGQLHLLAAEGCPLRRGGERVDMAKGRWDGVV
jgi:alkylated DNA nucleotide flippase Atl1